MTALLAVMFLLATGCDARSIARRAFSDPLHADSMGAKPTQVRKISMKEPKDLVESSAAVMSETQAGVFFTINDSGNDATLFALDTAGTTRGRWIVEGATNNDWEAVSRGPCSTTSGTSAPPSGSCLVIGDVGDNGASRRTVALYQVDEPVINERAANASLNSQKLVVRYSDGAHDVESLYVGPDGAVYLITKRALKDISGALRPALVFAVPPTAWASHDTVTAMLMDSLPIVPGSSSHRQLTDASLSPDGRLLAVRTYGQVFIFATDAKSGRVVHSIKPSVCNVEDLEIRPGEGITWVGATKQLLLTREGRNAPIQIITCPLPNLLPEP